MGVPWPAYPCEGMLTLKLIIIRMNRVNNKREGCVLLCIVISLLKDEFPFFQSFFYKSLIPTGTWIVELL